MGNDDIDPCVRSLNIRERRLDKWTELYTKSLKVIEVNLGKDNGQSHVYAALQTITTASREIQTIERVIATLSIGKDRADTGRSVGYDYDPDHEAKLVALIPDA